MADIPGMIRPEIQALPRVTDRTVLLLYLMKKV